MGKKPERNVDKIRRLEAEIAAERDRRRHADIEIVRMHKQVGKTRNDAALQLAEISTAADGLLIALAAHIGANVGPDTWEISLDVYSPSELCRRYQATTTRRGSKYIIRVSPKKQEEAQEK